MSCWVEKISFQEGNSSILLEEVNINIGYQFMQ
jgi:hypothetical protein